MYEQDRYPRGLGWIWALVVLIVVLLLLFGAWLFLCGEKNDDPIYEACTDAYRKDNQRDARCTCFAGILKVHLHERAYDAYIRDLELSEYRYGVYDLRPNRDTFAPHDGRVCVDASDICGVMACAPRPEYYQESYGFDGAIAPQNFESPPGTWGQR